MIRYVVFAAIFALSLCDEYIEWCEEPDIRRRISSGDCNQFSLIAYPSPTCICVKGIASLDVARSSELFFGDGGCFSMTAYGQNINSLRLERPIDSEKNLVAVQSTSTTVKSSSWLFHEFTAQPKLLYTNAPYYLLNVEAVDIGQQFKGLPIICLKRQSSADSSGIVQYFKMVSFHQVYLLLNGTCADGKSMEDTDLVASSLIASYSNRHCTPTCPALDNPAETTTLDMRDNLIRIQDVHDRILIQQRALGSSPAQNCQSLDAKDKDKHEKINKKLILEFIRESFTEFSDVAAESRAFEVLNKFFFIAKRYCKDAKISSVFLHQALRSFELVQRELSPSGEELFSREEYQALFHLLSHCQWEVPSLRMNTNGCSQQSNWVTSIYHPAGGEDHFEIPISDSYKKLSKHHLVVDVPYHVVDIALQACRRSFQRSPHLLEKLRARMLKLFTSEAIHKFWTNPGTLSNLNEHLFGPYWPESVRSLLKCAEAAYAFNGNSYRPLRPNADVSPQTNSTGSATCIEAQQLNSISDSYDIYCKKAQLEAVKITNITTPEPFGKQSSQYKSPIAEIPVPLNEPEGLTLSQTAKLKQDRTAREKSATAPKRLAVKAKTPQVFKSNKPARGSMHIPVLTRSKPFHRAYPKHSDPKTSHEIVPSIRGREYWPLVPDDDPGEAISRGSGRSIGKGIWNSFGNQQEKDVKDSSKHYHDQRNDDHYNQQQGRGVGNSKPPSGPPASAADGEVIIIDWPEKPPVGSAGGGEQNTEDPSGNMTVGEGGQAEDDTDDQTLDFPGSPEPESSQGAGPSQGTKPPQGTGPSAGAGGPANGDIMVSFPEDQEDPSANGTAGEGGDGGNDDDDQTLDFPGSPEPEPSPGTGPSQETKPPQSSGPSAGAAGPAKGDIMLTFPEDQEDPPVNGTAGEEGQGGDDGDDQILDFPGSPEPEPSPVTGPSQGQGPSQGSASSGGTMITFPEDQEEVVGEPGGNEGIDDNDPVLDFQEPEGTETSSMPPPGPATAPGQGSIATGDVMISFPEDDKAEAGGEAEQEEIVSEEVTIDFPGSTGGGGGASNIDDVYIEFPEGGVVGGSSGGTGDQGPAGNNGNGTEGNNSTTEGGSIGSGGSGSSNDTTEGSTTVGPKPPPPSPGQKYSPGYVFRPKLRKNRRYVQRKARRHRSKSY